MSKAERLTYMPKLSNSDNFLEWGSPRSSGKARLAANASGEAISTSQ